MHTATGLWMTHHGLKRLQRERADLRDWLGRIKLNVQRAITDHKMNKEIELILFEKETVKNRLKRVDAVLDHASELPLVWSHKFEARAGDTVYLRHKNSIRGTYTSSHLERRSRQQPGIGYITPRPDTRREASGEQGTFKYD